MRVRLLSLLFLMLLCLPASGCRRDGESSEGSSSATSESAPADTEEQGTTSEPETTPAKKGCGSTVSATALLISAGCALVLSKKREKFPC
jgi:hypothetical protein